MNRRLYLPTLIGAVLLVLAMPALASPKQMVLQVDPAALQSRLTAGESTASAIAVCDLFHEIYPNYCVIWHVIAVGGGSQEASPTTLHQLAGTVLRLQNASRVVTVRVERVAPLYRLESGATLAPAGDWNAADPRGERWIEVASGKSRVVTGWNNVSHTGLVGSADEVSFDDGESVKILDVGVGLHVREVVRAK